MSVLAWSLAAWSALALAMDRHHECALAQAPGSGRRRRLRIAGAVLLLAAFVRAIATQGWAFGVLLWFTSATAAGIAVVLLLAWWPHRLPRIALGVLLLGTAAAAVPGHIAFDF